MAARHLQKLRAQDLPSADTIGDDASESEEETTGPVNPFDLLDDKEVSCAELGMISKHANVTPRLGEI
jgi:hypothetical protein